MMMEHKTEPWRRVTGRLTGSVPAVEIDVPPAMAAAGVATAVEVTIGRTSVVVVFWAGGMETTGAFAGGGSPDVARAKALQRAYESGLRLRARWHGAAEAAE